MFDGVCERLARDEVRRRLDLGRQPPGRRPRERDVQRRAGGERLERAFQPLLGEDRGVHAAGELAQLRDGDLELLDCTEEHALDVGVDTAAQAPLRSS